MVSDKDEYDDNMWIPTSIVTMWLPRELKFRIQSIGAHGVLNRGVLISAAILIYW